MPTSFVRDPAFGTLQRVDNNTDENLKKRGRSRRAMTPEVFTVLTFEGKPFDGNFIDRLRLTEKLTAAKKSSPTVKNEPTAEVVPGKLEVSNTRGGLGRLLLCLTCAFWW